MESVWEACQILCEAWQSLWSMYGKLGIVRHRRGLFLRVSWSFHQAGRVGCCKCLELVLVGISAVLGSYRVKFSSLYADETVFIWNVTVSGSLYDFTVSMNPQSLWVNGRYFQRSLWVYESTVSMSPQSLWINGRYCQRSELTFYESTVSMGRQSLWSNSLYERPDSQDRKMAVAKLIFSLQQAKSLRKADNLFL